MDSDTPVKRGTTLTLFVMLPDNKHAVLVDEATVCWSRGHEFGLAIHKIQSKDGARLKDFITAHV